MADYALTGAELKRHIKMARDTSLAFAYNPGTPKEDDYFALNRKRPADQLGKAAKKDGPGAKATFGMARVEGKVLELRCELVLPGMARKLKQHLKKNKVTINVRIMDADGNVIEEDIEEIADDPDLFDGAPVPPAPQDDPRADDSDAGTDSDTGDTTAAQQDPTPPQDNPADIVAGLKRISPAVAAAPEPVGTKLKQAVAGIVADIKAGEIAKARANFAKLDAVVAKLTAPAPEAPAQTTAPDPQSEDDRLRALVAQAKATRADIDSAQVPDAARTKLMTAFQAATDALKARNLDQADAVLARIADALAKLGQATDQAAAPAPDANDADDGGFDQKAHNLKERIQDLHHKMVVLFGVEIQAALDERLDKATADLEAGIYSTAGPAMAFVEDCMRLHHAIEALTPDYTRAASTGAVEDVQRMRVLFDTAVEQIPGPDHAKAWACLQQVQDMIADGAEANANAFLADIPEDVRPFAISRLNWTSARTRMKGELDKLRDSIAKTVSGEPEYSEIIDNLGELYTHIDGLDLRLADRLDAIVNSAEGPDREARKAEARTILKEYQDELSRPFFQEVDSDNGFASVSVAATAQAALGDIDRVLAA